MKLLVDHLFYTKDIIRIQAECNPKNKASIRVLEKLGFYRVGLSEDDAKVYLALLRKGDRGEKVGNLDKELDLKRTHIYRIIDRLIEKDWVDKLSKTPTGAQYYIARPPKELLDNLIKEKKEEIKILEGILKTTDHQIVIARNGEEAEKTAKAFRPDLIFLDVVMPKKNGFQVCRDLRHDPLFKTTPIILLTSKSQNIIGLLKFQPLNEKFYI